MGTSTVKTDKLTVNPYKSFTEGYLLIRKKLKLASTNINTKQNKVYHFAFKLKVVKNSFQGT